MNKIIGEHYEIQPEEIGSENIELYNRIQTFSLDRPYSPLSFSKRLAKDNSWSLDYAKRVIEEYKKFVFLAVVAGHPVSPSDQVDQVWHLHLCYTRSYWQEFCPKILQTTLHHDPSGGGSSEQLKFDNLYNKTLESYKQFFGYNPPIDIWPKPKDRFGRDLNFVRINTQQNLILSKPNWEVFSRLKLQQVITFPLLIFLSLAITSCQVISKFPNPINFTGMEFLTFYISLGVVGISLASWLRFSLRLPENQKDKFPNLNAYEVAFLAGGNDRMNVVAIASLFTQDHVEIVKEESPLKSKLVLKTEVNNITDPVEKAVSQFILETDGAIKQASQKNAEIGDMIRSRLQHLGLLLNDEQALKAQIYPSLIILILLVLGLCRMFVGLYHGRPVGFLIGCMFILLLFGSRFFVKPDRSRYGDRVFNDLTARSKDLKTPKSVSEIALAVALYGVTVLATDSALAELHQILAPTTASGADGGSGCGGDGGGDGGGCGGGGCGGGCGGCGGCGG